MSSSAEYEPGEDARSEWSPRSPSGLDDRPTPQSVRIANAGGECHQIGALEALGSRKRLEEKPERDIGASVALGASRPTSTHPCLRRRRLGRLPLYSMMEFYGLHIELGLKICNDSYHRSEAHLSQPVVPSSLFVFFLMAPPVRKRPGAVKTSFLGVRASKCGGRFQARFGEWNGTFDTAQEAAEALAKHRGVPVRTIEKKEARSLVPNQRAPAKKIASRQKTAVGKKIASRQRIASGKKEASSKKIASRKSASGQKRAFGKEKAPTQLAAVEKKVCFKEKAKAPTKPVSVQKKAFGKEKAPTKLPSIKKNIKKAKAPTKPVSVQKKAFGKKRAAPQKKAAGDGSSFDENEPSDEEACNKKRAVAQTLDELENLETMAPLEPQVEFQGVVARNNKFMARDNGAYLGVFDTPEAAAKAVARSRNVKVRDLVIKPKSDEVPYRLQYRGVSYDAARKRYRALKG